mmetsp:Transcript_25585/g.47003  ORF Transcript_25585/g.47003 Transcript_25585/m.47003 type:complete len:105 (-) Transcript_25585:10-324(-)
MVILIRVVTSWVITVQHVKRFFHRSVAELAIHSAITASVHILARHFPRTKEQILQVFGWDYFFGFQMNAPTPQIDTESAEHYKSTRYGVKVFVYCLAYEAVGHG